MKNFLRIALVIIIGISCKDSTLPPPTPVQELPEDFVVFYKKFLADSAYQMNHILFPLAGLPSQANPETDDLDNFRWKKDAWTLHRDFDPKTSGFDRSFVLVSDELIIEYIIHTSHKFGLERRFSKSDGKWYLIYYSGVNEIKK